MDQVRLDGKTAIVTGANTGIGKETAKELAKRGCRVILACRSEERAIEAINDLVDDPEVKSDDLVFMNLDLSSLQSVREFGNEFNAKEPRLDLLVNNAGVFVVQERSTTVDGFETHFGVNHLGHFLLTLLLLDKLKSSAPSRVITVSSEAHKYSKIDFEDLQFEKGWKSLESYWRSKTANILFTVELARRLQGTGVTAHSLHPGLVKTDLGRSLGKCASCLIACLLNFCFCCCVDSMSQGAKTTLYCCLEPSLSNVSGLYYSKCREARAAPHATDPAIAERLWQVSEELVELSQSGH